jgi:5-methylcytosine-specific restriction protein B
MDQVYPEPQSLVNATQCFDFAHRMATGDWIFAKKGRREIIGFGIVRSDYRFDLGRASYQHVRYVDWQKAGRWPTGPTRMLSMKTLTEITEDEALLDELEELMEITDAETPSVVVNVGRLFILPPTFQLSRRSRKKQSSFRGWWRKAHYFSGPPGTGKTYVADRLARLLISDTFEILKPCNSIPHTAMKTS